MNKITHVHDDKFLHIPVETFPIQTPPYMLVEAKQPNAPKPCSSPATHQPPLDFLRGRLSSVN